jgi:RHS repeat-associated protein
MRKTRSAIALLILALAAPLLSGAEPQERGYVVSLKSAQAAGDPGAVAVDLTRLYGGRLAKQGSGGQAFVMHLSESRARLVAADPRVQSVAPLAPAPAADEPKEVVSWTSGVSYAYDASGNVRQVGKDTFVYDHAGRMIQAEVNGIRRDYEYDAYGNRQKCTQAAGTAAQSDCQGYTVDSDDNHIVGAVYDPAGSGAVASLGLHSYSWDEFQMLRRDQSPDPREFVYTADDERVATYYANSRSWNWTVRDQDKKVLREFASSGGSLGTSSFRWEKDYVWRDKLLLASVQPEGGAVTRYHYHLDHLGTPRRITDLNDNLVAFHDYFAFGPRVNGGKDEPSYTALKYTGHERDLAGDALGTLDYMHARYYSPELGRFLSIDPAMDLKKVLPRPQRWNRYAYVSNSPMTATDPDGREEYFMMERWFAEQQAVNEGKMSIDDYWARRRAEGYGGLAGVGLVGVGAAIVYGGPPAWSAAGRLVWQFRAWIAMLGTGGAVGHQTLQRLAAGGGPTVQVFTNLSRAPQMGRQLYAATGPGAQQAANAARPGAPTYVANIPQALLRGLEDARLVEVSTLVQKGSGVVTTQYYFLPEAIPYIIKFFEVLR